MKRFAAVMSMALFCAASLAAQDRGPLGLGYDEGLAVRYFFSDRVGLQAAIGFEHLGESDLAGADNEFSATDVSLSAALVYNFLESQHFNFDGLAQLAFLHDDRDDRGDPSDAGDRDYVFLRVAGAPEIFIGRHLGLGLRFGIELASISGTENEAGADVDDGEVDFRFFGPRNPFAAGNPNLGMSLYVYF